MKKEAAMKNRVLLSAVLCSWGTLAQAQAPTVQVYLNENLTQIHRHGNCPPFATIDTVYVVASGFSSPITDIEYRIDAYANFEFAVEQFPSGFSGLGLTAEGVKVSFGAAIDASDKVVVETIIGLWYCECGAPGFPYIEVLPHPASGKIQATRYPDTAKIEAVGGYNSLCGVLPTEQSTWGRVKALYR